MYELVEDAGGMPVLSGLPCLQPKAMSARVYSHARRNIQDQRLVYVLE